MDHAGLLHGAGDAIAHAHAARLPLLTELAAFQRALNDQFDSARHAERYRPGQALVRLQAGVTLLCDLQQSLLHPALVASRGAGWPALTQAMHDVAALRRLVSSGPRASDTQQRTLVTLIEGVVQLHFASLDELLAHADPAATPWQRLTAETRRQWQAWQFASTVPADVRLSA